MADDEPDAVQAQVDEAEQVRAWRVMQAMVLGYEWAEGVRIADSEIDLHALHDLISGGATHGQALRILE